jgi:membrane-bound metal-dependent hydrolase YbcI (DUF457 family)
MPDLLAHYLSSYLVAQAFVKHRRAVLLALVGVLADLDALLRIHRWVTHSLVVAFALFTPVLLALYLYKEKHLKIVLLALLLYTLHIALDTLTTLTPALWPLAPQIRVIVEMTGAVGSKGLLLATTIATGTRPTDFTQKAYVEGPIVSEVGVVVAVVTLVLTVAEHMAKKSRVRA